MTMPGNETHSWTIHHSRITESTNIDARCGHAGDVFTTDFQTGGRGRLNHKWLSSLGENLMMSAVFDVAGIDAQEVATLPLTVGLSVANATSQILTNQPVSLKWPNDVLVGGRKIAGILCERHGDNVIAGIGVNVNQIEFSPEIFSRATSFRLLGKSLPIVFVRDLILLSLEKKIEKWREKKFVSLLPEIRKIDCLRGKVLSVLQTDNDENPLTGLCEGINKDGSLKIAGINVYAGEAHILS